MKEFTFVPNISNREGTTIRIPESVLSLGLAPQEFYLYAMILYFKMQLKKYPTAKELAGPRLGLGLRSVQELTRSLENKGAIRRV